MRIFLRLGTLVRLAHEKSNVSDLMRKPWTLMGGTVSKGMKIRHKRES